MPDASYGAPTFVEQPQVGDAIVYTRHELVPLFERLVVDSSEIGEALLLQVPDEPAPDEATCAGDENGMASRRRVRCEHLLEGLCFEDLASVVSEPNDVDRTGVPLLGELAPAVDDDSSTLGRRGKSLLG